MQRSPYKSVLDPARFDLGCLTPSEQLWVWRRRQLSTDGRILGRSGTGMSQAEAAASLGMRTQDYRALEVGETLPDDAAPQIRALLTALGSLRAAPSELCRIARRREGMNLREASVAAGWYAARNIETATDAVGWSHVHYLATERVGDPALVRFWEDRGYRFPPQRENARVA